MEMIDLQHPNHCLPEAKCVVGSPIVLGIHFAKEMHNRVALHPRATSRSAMRCLSQYI